MKITEPHHGRRFQRQELEHKLLCQKPECTPDETFVYHLVNIGIATHEDFLEGE